MIIKESNWLKIEINVVVFKTVNGSVNIRKNNNTFIFLNSIIFLKI